MSSTLWYKPNIAIYRQIIPIRVGYYELGWCLNSIHSNLWIIALNFDLFRSIIGPMVGCRWGCYGRLKRPPSYQNIVLHQCSRRVQRKLVLVRCWWHHIGRIGFHGGVCSKIGLFCSYISAGVALGTTKLNGGMEGGMVRAAIKWHRVKASSYSVIVAKLG